jgi:ABC-type lipoprotein export system ATPase subunit
VRVTGSGLGHRFRGRPWLFQDVDITLRAGFLTGLAGPSGSGKSTLLGILAGWIAPSVGTVSRDGVLKVGWVFQNPVGVARRTALDHVTLPMIGRGAHRSDAEGDAMGLCRDFGLGEVANHPFSALSGGEAQRLMLARATAARPDLLLVDEPTAQLDRESAGTVSSVLGALARTEMIVVVASHDQRLLDACREFIDLGER